MLDEVTLCFLNIAREIAQRQQLLIVHPAAAELKLWLQTQLGEELCRNIRVFRADTNDTWARDHAFITVFKHNTAHLLDFRFNGWGGKFEANLDNELNLKLSRVLLRHTVYENQQDFELEGGGIESDGCGTILTSTACLLNTNRRRRGDAVEQADREAVEAVLRQRLGAERILWLTQGHLEGDDTDAHIDTLARLCPNNTIAYVQCTDPTDSHYASLQSMESELKEFRTPTGEAYRLVPLPHTDPIYDETGERLPATYANFLITNRAVLVPTYAQPEKDTAAIKALQNVFPRHEIVGIDCRALIRQHGSLHCVTMQYPVGVEINL